MIIYILILQGIFFSIVLRLVSWLGSATANKGVEGLEAAVARRAILRVEQGLV
jgi:hypothetical protein